MNAALPLLTPQSRISSRAPRILALRFPRLTTDRISRKLWGPSWRLDGRPDHPPILVYHREGPAIRVCAVDETGSSHGLRRGQGLAEARAICPDVDAREADPSAERRLIEALADWASRYTPLVGLSGEDGLFLDITGSSHLFGGEKPLLDDLLMRLFHFGFAATGAVAASPGLAHALASHRQDAPVETGEAAEALAPLPVRALRLEPEIVARLVKAGLERIGDLMPLPRAPLARRFGAGLLQRLDQALGLDDEPISPRLPVASLSVDRRLIEPIVAEDDILGLARQMAERLCSRLAEQGLGGRRFELQLYRVDGRMFSIRADCASALRDAGRMAALFAGRMAALHEDFDAGYGFETLRLSAIVTEAFDDRQEDFHGAEQSGRALGDFIDQTSARFGPASLLVPVSEESHIPERACRLVPALEAGLASGPTTGPVSDRVEMGARAPAGVTSGQGSETAPDHGLARPIRLFQRPEPVEAVAEVPEGPPVNFRWRRTLHHVRHAEGPERLAAEWWVDGLNAPTRDYYRIEDRDGRRYWLFREGLYEREAGTPRWFMHGIFA